MIIKRDDNKSKGELNSRSDVELSFALHIAAGGSFELIVALYMLNAGRVRDIASGVSSELWHGRRLRHAKHRIAYLPSSEQLISFQLINRSLESSRERANFFLQQKNSNLLSLSIRIECLISNETRATNGYTGGCVGSGSSVGSHWKPNSIWRHSILDGDEEARETRTRPSAAGSFVSRCGQRHRWHWQQTAAQVLTQQRDRYPPRCNVRSPAIVI